MRRPLPLAALAAACVLAPAACGDEKEAAPAAKSSTTAEAAPAKATTADDLATAIGDDTSSKPAIPKPVGAPPTQLVTKDIVKGKGPAAKAGDTVTVQYDGVSWSTGGEFDASWNSGKPFSFPLGAGKVIPGWDQGVAGMRKGGRRLLIIPPGLGYGAQGSPPAIKPNETLVFVVDLEKVG